MAGMKLSNTKIKSGGADKVKLEDIFDLYTFETTDFKTTRLVGDMVAIATHWFEVTTKEGGKARFGLPCRNVNPDGTDNPKGKCPACGIKHQARAAYASNAIDTKIEDAGPPRKDTPPTKAEAASGFKTKGSGAWTPVRVLVFPPSVAQTMQKLTLSNKNKAGDVKELSDPRFGRALDLSRDTKLAAANMWSVQRSETAMRKLTEEQLEYLTWDLTQVSKLQMTVEELKAELIKSVPRISDPKERAKLNFDDYPEIAAAMDASGTGGKKSRKGSFATDDEDSDEDEAPRKRRRVVDEEDEDDDRPLKKHRRPADEDEDDADEEDTDDEDEEDEPPPRKKKKVAAAPAKGKKKRAFDPSNMF